MSVQATPVRTKGHVQMASMGIAVTVGMASEGLTVKKVRALITFLENLIHLMFKINFKHPK